MFEAAELGRKVSKEEYQQKEPALRTELLKLQFELRERDFPVLVALSGNDRASCNEVLNVLHAWMDPRFLSANAWGFPTQEETEKPFFWRYWQSLPPKGRIGIFLRGWTMQSIVLRLLDEIDDVAFEHLIGHIRRFEQAQVDDGALLVKFWFHLPEKKAKKRLKAAAKGKQTVLMVKRQDLKVYRDYDRALAVMESALRQTSRGETPWNIVESSDERYRNLTVAEILHAELSRRLEMKSEAAPAAQPEGNGTVRNALTILDKIDLSKKLPRDEYHESLKKLQETLNRLSTKARREGLSTVLVFEGWDAAGKGGIVRRITAAIDASLYRIIPVAAPTEEERAHQYLWRFWRHLPRAGQFTIFDRSWYGRVLVERVEGFATEAQWRRAYAEINDFEEQLTEHGIVLLKFWLHIDKDEQLKRFQAREQTSFKKYKITAEDYRNRERWNDYELAANDMIERTSTESARWHLIAANDKRSARVQVIETVSDALEKALKRSEKK